MDEVTRQRFGRLEKKLAELEERLRVFEDEKAEEERLIREGLKNQFGNDYEHL